MAPVDKTSTVGAAVVDQVILAERLDPCKPAGSLLNGCLLCFQQSAFSTAANPLFKLRR